MLLDQPLIIAEYDGQKFYNNDIVSVYHAAMKQDIFYIVHYFMSDHKFYLVPISGVVFPTLPLTFLNEHEWEYYGQPDNIIPPFVMAGPNDTFIENLSYYLTIHYKGR